MHHFSWIDSRRKEKIINRVLNAVKKTKNNNANARKESKKVSTKLHEVENKKKYILKK